MIERVAKSSVVKAIDPGELISSQPLNFQLYYANKDGRAEIINTVYLEDGNPKLDLCLEVFNESSENITFTSSSVGKLSTVQAGGNSAASAQRCHFYLRWEKDLQIKPSEISVEPANQWQVNYDEDSHFFTLYFLHKSGLVLEAQNPTNDSDRVLLTFKNFTANNSAVKTSNVELLYGSPLLLNGEGEEFPETLSSKNAISITNHPDNKNIPLQFRFIGPNTILNDGTTQNSLKLQIINRPPSNNTRPNLLLDKTNSKFIVSFETDNSAEALTISDKVNNVSITSTDTNNWKVDKTQNAAEWTIKLNNSSTKDKLTSKEAIALEIKNIVTSNPSGVAYLYITYQNIGGYPDGQLVVPVEKTPLLYRNTQVGIGINNPLAKLHVSGGDAIIGGKLTSTGDAIIGGKVGIGITYPSANAAPKIHLAIGDDDTGLNQQGDGKLAIYTDNQERVRIEKNGNVGIGTITPLDKLHVDGNIRLSGNINGANQKLSIYSNTTPGNSNAWIELWGNTNGDSNRTGELSLTGKYIEFRYNSTDSTDGSVGMRLTSDGKLGIGTTSPTHQLHIKGQNSTLRLEGQGNYGVGATLNFGDNQEVYIKEDEDKKLLIHADTRITLDSNVGIGTTSPSAKLDVHGDFHIRGRKPIEYRIYSRENFDQPTFATGYNYPEWIAIVAGFNCSANNSIAGLRVFPCVKDGKWIISCDMSGSSSERFWNISIIFIKGELVSLISGGWGPPPNIPDPS